MKLFRTIPVLLLLTWAWAHPVQASKPADSSTHCSTKPAGGGNAVLGVQPALANSSDDASAIEADNPGY